MTTALKRPSVVEAEPASEPLTLAEAKKHLEIAQADSAHDAHVSSLIVMARQRLERDIGTVLISRSVVEKHEEWPLSPWRLFARPASAITHIKYYTGSTLTTLSSANYSLDADRNLVHIAATYTLPSVDDRWDAIQMTYTAGNGTDSQNIPEVYRHAMKLLIENAFDDRHKDATSLLDAYENLIRPWQRATYP